MENKTSTDSMEKAVEINEVLLSMTQGNWILLRATLDLTREEITSDEGLLVLLTVWKKSETTKANLVRLLDVPTRDLYSELGIDLDAAMSEAIAEAKANQDDSAQ